MDVHDYAKQIEMAKAKVLTYREGQLACSFLDHLTARGLSRGRVATYAIKLRTVVKMTDGLGLSLRTVTRVDAEKVMSAINAGGYQLHSSTVQYKPTTKAALAITFKKLVQYAQAGRTDRDQLYPEAVSWIKARVKDDDTRATPEKVLKEEEFLILVNNAKNKRDKALFYVLYEGLPPVYNELVRRNFLQLSSKLPLFGGATRVIVTVYCRDTYARLEEPPVLEVIELMREGDTGLAIGIYRSESRPANVPAFEQLSETIVVDGKEYKVVGASKGILDLVYDELPMLKLVYDELHRRLRKCFQTGLSVV